MSELGWSILHTQLILSRVHVQQVLAGHHTLLVSLSCCDCKGEDEVEGASRGSCTLSRWKLSLISWSTAAADQMWLKD